MLRSANFLVFCGHCHQGAAPFVWSSDASPEAQGTDVVHNVYWPNGWIGTQNKYGLFSKCQYCIPLYPPLVDDIVYHAILVVGILNERTFWSAPIKVGPKIEFNNHIKAKHRTKDTFENKTKVQTNKAKGNPNNSIKDEYVSGTSGGSNGCRNTNSGARVRTSSDINFYRCRRRHSTGDLRPGFRNNI